MWWGVGGVVCVVEGEGCGVCGGGVRDVVCVVCVVGGERCGGGWEVWCVWWRVRCVVCVWF